MGWWDRVTGRREARAVTPESVFGGIHGVSDFMTAVGLMPYGQGLPHVSIESALQVPAISAAVTFLSRELGTLPLHLFKGTGESAETVDTGLAIILRDAVNPEMTSADWRKWFWQQIFTGGRGLSWIERNGSGQVAAIWPMDPGKTKIERRNGRMLYRFDGQADPYGASEVIDLAWMLRADGVGHYAPVQRGARAISASLAMMDYEARLFSKGGVPPLQLIGPPGVGQEAMKRAIEQVAQAMAAAQESGIPITRLPAGFELKPIGFNPQDSQFVEGKKAANLDHARLYNLPPVFLQDLEFATFTNSEQQDLQLVKHVLVGWCILFEQQLNLKLFGPKRADRYVKHNIDGIMRGDFLSRINGISRAVQTSLLTPNEGRGLLDRPRMDEPKADQLFMQGATVPIDGIDPAAGGTTDQNGGTGNAN